MVDAQPEFYLEAASTAVSRARLLDATAVTVAAARLGNLAGLVGAARWAINQAVSAQPLRPAFSP